MVRPDEAKRSPSAQEERSVSGCTEPAGESPAPVGAGAPGSRPRASGEIPAAQAGCREPLRREQARGPQHQVNAAASSDKQRESRAAHVTAKATSDDPVPERSAGFLGVGAVARAQGSVRNRRGPSARPESGQGDSYKPKVKASAAQRESEGVVVLVTPAQQNAGRGKDPYGDHVGSGATCEGMAGHEDRSNSPIRPSSDAKARHLQRRLWANIYLHVLDERWTREYAHLGTLVRYADDFVVMCDTAEQCEEAERVVRRVLEDELGLELHPEKTRRVELTWGKEGFDFLGCHLRKRMSGRLWEQYRRRRYYLQRWPSATAMKRVRERVHALTDRRWNGVKDVRELIRRLNPVLRGWGNYFRTGNAARKFNQLDSYVYRRLRQFLVRRKGRNLRAGEFRQWTRDFFWGLGLHRLRGTVRYPGAA